MQLLPFSEHESLYHSVNFELPLDDSTNASVRVSSLSLAVLSLGRARASSSLYREYGQCTSRAGTVQDGARLACVGEFRRGVRYKGPRDRVDGKWTVFGSVLMGRVAAWIGSDTLLVGNGTGSKLPSAWLGFANHGEDGPSANLSICWNGPNRDDSDESEFLQRHPGCANFLWPIVMLHPFPIRSIGRSISGSRREGKMPSNSLQGAGRQFHAMNWKSWTSLGPASAK